MIKKRKNQEVVIPTSSLADIAFLLLIFFLVSTTINSDKGIGLVLPPVGSTKPVPKKNICNVLINASGQVLMGGEQIQIPLIKEEARRRITENPNLIFSVKTARETLYNTYIEVLDQLKLAGARKISIAEPET